MSANIQRNGKQVTFKWNRATFDVQSLLKDDGISPSFTTALGALFAGDCTRVLPSIADASADTIFADPPFNLGKDYGENTDDSRPDEAYLEWCKRWIVE